MFIPRLDLVAKIYAAKDKALDPNAGTKQQVATAQADAAIQAEVDRGGQLLAGVEAPPAGVIVDAVSAKVG